MPDTFAALYASLLKNDVFTTRAQENIAQGSDGLTCALAYAEQGKPDFTLAYLLLIDISDKEKHEILAVSYERRAHKGRAIRSTIPPAFPPDQARSAERSPDRSADTAREARAPGYYRQ